MWGAPGKSPRHSLPIACACALSARPLGLSAAVWGEALPLQEASPGIGLKRELGFWDLLTFGVVSMAPIASFTMFGFVDAASGGASIPAYAIAAVALAFTAVSYGTMAQAEPSAGASFAYARLAMGSFAGFVAGWAIVLDYLLLLALLAVFAAIFLNAAFPAVDTNVWLAGFLVLSLTVNILGVRWSLSVDLAVAGAQFLFCAVFVVMAIALVSGGTYAPAPLWPASFSTGTIVSGASVAVITYLGFDAVVTLTEEVRGARPGHVAGRAALAAVLVMMGVYFVISWLLASLAQGLTFPDASQTAFVIVSQRLPGLVWLLSLVAALALGVGCTVSVQAAVSRLLFGMARERHLPSAIALLSPRARTPWVAILVSSGIAAVIAIFALPNVDVLGQMVSFGALVAFLFVNLSVVAHFAIRQRSRSVVRHWVVPLLGAGVVLYVLASVNPLALKLGIAWLVLGAVIYFAGKFANRLVTAGS